MWGSRFVVVRLGLSHVPPLSFAALSLDVAAVALLMYAVVAEVSLRPVRVGEWVDVAASGVLVVGASQALYFLGQQHTTGAAAAILFGIIPVLVAVLSRVLLPSERLTTVGFVGLLVGFAGVAIVVRPSPSAVLTERFLGNVLVVGAAACFAVGTVVSRLVAGEVQLPLVSRQAWAMTIGAFLLHALGFVMGGPPAGAPIGAAGVAAVVYVGLVPSAASYLVYFDLLDRLGPIDVNLVTYVVPVATVLLGRTVLGERVAPVSFFGFGVVFAGFALVKRAELTALYDRIRGSTNGLPGRTRNPPHWKRRHRRSTGNTAVSTQTMSTNDFAVVSPADASWSVRESGVLEAAITRRLGCTDTTVDLYRLRAGGCASPRARRESVVVPVDAPIELTVSGTRSVPPGAVVRVPAGVGWVVRAEAATTVVVLSAAVEPAGEASATVVDLDDLEFSAPETSDVLTARLTDRLGCVGMKVNVRRLEPGQAVPYHTEGGQEELFVPLDGPGTMRIDGGTYPVVHGGVARVAPPVPRAAVNEGDEDRTWLMVGAPPTGAADEWDPGAEFLEWPGPDEA